MSLRVHIIDTYGDGTHYTSFRKLLEEKIELLAKLYDVNLSILPRQSVLIWIGRGSANNVITATEMKIDYNSINYEMNFELQLPGPVGISLEEILLADDQLMDYVAFYIAMACKPQQQLVDDEMITYYTLKYGYKG